jgi:ketosteroid isomerase-like protein
MSKENVDIVRRAYERFLATGTPAVEMFHSDFVWDMSKFRGWPEQQMYPGLEGTRQFLSDWLASWDEWQLELEELHDAGDRVVAVMRQRGRSKVTGVVTEMHFAQVWTLREGKQVRMEMYADPHEALEAAGLAE